MNALENEIGQFSALITTRLGLQLEESNFSQLADLLRERSKEVGIPSISSYLHWLNSSGDTGREFKMLAERLTVGETYFFRHRDQFFAFVQHAVPQCLSTIGPHRPLRILSAGCATGEEAYSMAILIRENFPWLAESNLKILGIDLRPSFIRRANRAHYSDWSFRDTPTGTEKRFFRHEKAEHILVDTIRSLVTFEERNLIEPDPNFWHSGAFDIIFCRNVLMYFSKDVMQEVILRLVSSLAPGGFLFLGPSETIRTSIPGLHLRHTNDTFYYQKGSDSVPVPEDTLWGTVVPHVTSLGSEAPPTVTTAPPDLDAVRELLREERFEDAMKLLEAFPRGTEVDTDFQLLKAVVLTNQGRISDAETVCQELLAIDEFNAGAHYLKALSREHAGDRKAAVEQNQVAVYLDPTFAMPHLHLGLIAKRSGDRDTARRELRQAENLLLRESASRILLFGGGFSREALLNLCQAELRAFGNHHER